MSCLNMKKKEHLSKALNRIENTPERINLSLGPGGPCQNTVMNQKVLFDNEKMFEVCDVVLQKDATLEPFHIMYLTAMYMCHNCCVTRIEEYMVRVHYACFCCKRKKWM